MTAIDWGFFKTEQPKQAAEYRTLHDELPDCMSRLMLLPDEDGPRPALYCSLKEGHPLDQVDLRHGSGLARWTNEEAAEAHDVWDRQFDGVCGECPARIRRAGGNLCPECVRRRHADDLCESEVDAA